jgi:hypothetical protein
MISPSQLVLLALAAAVQPDSARHNGSEPVSLAQDSTIVADSTAHAAANDAVRSHMHHDSISAGASPAARPPGSNADSIDTRGDSLHTADSLSRIARRDSLLALQARTRAQYHPALTNLDSIFSHSFLLPYDFFSGDASGVSSAMMYHPLYIRIPYALESSLNRYLYRGLPWGDGVDDFAGRSAGFEPDPSTGADMTAPAEIKSVRWSPEGTVAAAFHPDDLLSPQMLMMWENGVFDENVLNVRFARPLSKRLHVGVFSNYRSLARQRYSHRRGGISAFYESIYMQLGIDTARMSYTGQNPLTREHIVGSRLRWSRQDGGHLSAAYSYADLHNDIAVSLLDTISQEASLRWSERSLYRHDMRGGLHALRLGPLVLDAAAALRSDVHRLNPLWTADRNERGTNRSYAGRINPALPIATDTISFLYRASAAYKTLYSGQMLKSQVHHATARYSHALSAGAASGAAYVEGGYEGARIDDDISIEPVWTAGVRGEWGGQRLALYAKRAMLALALPYDSLSAHTAATRFFHSYGAQLRVSHKKAGLMLGYHANADLARDAVNRQWTAGMAPYDAPGSVLTIAPMFGRWRGLALSSALFVSDRRPYLKNHTVASLLLSSQKQVHRFGLDLIFDYWSPRDPLSFGGIDTWHSPIIDLHLKMTVQVQNFRLFYKVDNMLNRRNAYIPGYFMPGLTFRWGFNWLLHGW